MADVEENNEALKSNSSPAEDAAQIVLTPATVSSTPIIMEKTVVDPGSTDNMDEPEKVKDEGNAIVGLKIDEEQNKETDLIGEKDEAQAVREDVVIGKDEKIEEQINWENLGEGSKRKRWRPRKRNKKKKLAQEASEMVAAIVAANNGLAIDEEHNKEKAIGEEETQKEDAVKEASVEGEDEEKTKGGLKIDEGSNKEKTLTGEKAEAQAVTEDSVSGKEEEKTQEQINGDNLGESSKGKKRKPRKWNKKKKVAEKTFEIVAVDEDEANATVAANNGLTVDEELNKEKAIEEEETHEDAAKEASIKEQDEQKTEEKKNEERLEESSKGTGRKPRKRKRNKKVAQQGLEMVALDGDKPESSSKKKASKVIKSAGMIFMCSSKTKADCFRYKILGLPAGKKDQVAQIYNGMRLFLFDVDLRLMYGIFKAAGAGGYNIEPKAFKSAFPSQVRFTVAEDCSPLPEEKFRIAIKENYYTRNKFECQLNTQQVKNLCKLFHITGKSNPNPKKAVKKHENQADQKKRKRWAREDKREPHPPEPRRHPGYGQGQGQTPVIYERADPGPGPRYHLPVLDPGPVRSYGYERTYSYARDPVLDHRSYRVLDSRDHYHVYSREAEPPIYRDNVYPPLEYREPIEYRLLSREYNPPNAVQPGEHHLSGGMQISSYRSSASSLSGYHSYGTHYGY